MMSPLYAAARRGDVSAVAAVLDAGADPDGPGDDHGTTALTVAAFQGHVDVVRLLLARGADIDRSQPLAAAARNERTGIISLLLDAGASLTAEGTDGLTAFMAAASMSPRTVRAFLNRSGVLDVNAVSSKGITALHIAAINSRHGPDIVRLLLDAGADPMQRDAAGRTPIDLAIERGRAENARALGSENSSTAIEP